MCAYRARRKEHLIRHLRSHIGDLISSSDCGWLRDESESVITRDEPYSPASKDTDDSIAPSSVGAMGILGVRQSLAEWPMAFGTKDGKEKEDLPQIKDEFPANLPPTPMFALQQGLSD